MARLSHSPCIMKPIADAAWSLPVPGTIVAGKYVIETECGRDGLAAIFSALQLGLERRVVIRVLLPDWADDPQAVEQFRKEGRAAAHLASDTSRRVIDSGKLDSGAPYQVLDYLAEHEFAPVDRSTLPETVRGSDRVVASALLMLGALGTAAFLWAYSTVHANDNRNLGAAEMQPTANVLDDAGTEAGTAATESTAMDAGMLVILPSGLVRAGIDAGPSAKPAAAIPANDAGPAAIEALRAEPRAAVHDDGVAAEPRRATVVHVEPNPVAPAPLAAAAPDTATNPYADPTPDPSAASRSAARNVDAGAQNTAPNDDNGPTSEDRLLDRRQ